MPLFSKIKKLLTRKIEFLSIEDKGSGPTLPNDSPWYIVLGIIVLDFFGYGLKERENGMSYRSIVKTYFWPIAKMTIAAISLFLICVTVIIMTGLLLK